MRAKEAKLELVTYKTDNIAEATVALISNFAKYSRIYGTREWIGAIVHLLRIIDRQQNIQHALSAEGVEVSFSGFPNPIPTVDKDGNIIFKAREPRFTIRDHWEEISPRQRTRIAMVTSDIAGEMREVYHLETKYPPYTLIFPKELYAKERVVFDAALLL